MTPIRSPQANFLAGALSLGLLPVEAASPFPGSRFKFPGPQSWSRWWRRSAVFKLSRQPVTGVPGRASVKLSTRCCCFLAVVVLVHRRNHPLSVFEGGHHINARLNLNAPTSKLNAQPQPTGSPGPVLESHVAGSATTAINTHTRDARASPAAGPESAGALPPARGFLAAEALLLRRPRDALRAASGTAPRGCRAAAAADLFCCVAHQPPLFTWPAVRFS
jgi:hypothetical protein